jgi:predicted RNA-binding protein with PUA-like domain
MATAYWLVKSEPYKYPFAQLQKDGRTIWDGVRNFEARNNLRAMKQGDLVLYYHSNEGKEVVGIARVVRTAYADPTAEPEEEWAVVDVAPLCPLQQPVSLGAIKAEPRLQAMALLRRSRISVVPVTPTEFQQVLKMGRTQLPRGTA